MFAALLNSQKNPAGAVRQRGGGEKDDCSGIIDEIGPDRAQSTHFPQFWGRIQPGMVLNRCDSRSCARVSAATSDRVKPQGTAGFHLIHQADHSLGMPTGAMLVVDDGTHLLAKRAGPFGFLKQP